MGRIDPVASNKFNNFWSPPEAATLLKRYDKDPAKEFRRRFFA
jgi:hypothetical protein